MRKLKLPDDVVVAKVSKGIPDHKKAEFLDTSKVAAISLMRSQLTRESSIYSKISLVELKKLLSKATN